MRIGNYNSAEYVAVNAAMSDPSIENVMRAFEFYSTLGRHRQAAELIKRYSRGLGRPLTVKAREIARRRKQTELITLLR